MTGRGTHTEHGPIDPATIVYGAAQPNHEAIAAELIWSSGYEIFGYNYGDKAPFIRTIEAAWGADDGIFCHRYASAAYAADKLIGLELGFTSQTLPQRVPDHITAQERALTPAQFTIVQDRWPEIAPIVPELPEDAYYVSNLAALPHAQGRGVGYRLLTDAFTRAKADGFNWVLLDVCCRKPAVRFYQQVGMIPLVETRLPQLEEPFDVPMHIRMGMKLADWHAPQTQD